LSVAKASWLWTTINFLHHRTIAVPPEVWSWEAESLLPTLSPAVNEQELHSLLSIVLPSDEIKDYIEFLSPRFDKPVDLQYTPFWHTGSQVYVPSNILGVSNAVRNAFSVANSRGGLEDFQESEAPEIGRLLTEVFSKHTECIETRRLFGIEVDFAALIGNVLFVFECKDSILPTNVFELRTTVDYLEKAEAQLTDRVSRLRELLSNKPQQWKSQIVSEEVQIIPAIITRTRMFVGYSGFGYPIRPVHEICTMVKDGVVSIYNGDDWIPFNLRGEEEGIEQFISSYLEDTHPLVALDMNAMKPRHLTYKFRDFTLVQHTHWGTSEDYYDEYRKTLRVLAKN
jgi:hypothetical protein